MRDQQIGYQNKQLDVGNNKLKTNRTVNDQKHNISVLFYDT